MQHDPAQSRPDPICLDQFLKFTGIAETGGHAKILIQNGEVRVNGEVETRRRRKLNRSDVVEIHGQTLRVDDYLAPWASP